MMASLNVIFQHALWCDGQDMITAVEMKNKTYDDTLLS